VVFDILCGVHVNILGGYGVMCGILMIYEVYMVLYGEYVMLYEW
jgi:hypothetical protein